MARITATAKIYPEVKSSGFQKRDLVITIERDYEIVGTYDGIEWTPDGDAVKVHAGDMLLWEGDPDEMTGWMRSAVDEEIKAGPAWDVGDKEAREALEEEAENEAFIREHRVGM